MRRPGVLLFLLLLAAFAPAFLNTYSYHNDLGFWFGDFGTGYFESGHLFLLHRPLGAILLDAQTNLARPFPTVSLLLVFRIVTLALVVRFGLMLDGIAASHTRLTPAERAALVAVALLQPSWLLTVVWTTNLVPGVVAYLAGLGAAVALERAWDKSTHPISPKLIIPSLLLAGSVLIYPAGALTFFWLTLLKVCLGTRRYEISHFVRTTAFFAIVAFCALALDQILIQSIACRGDSCHTWVKAGSPSYSLAPASDFVPKLEVLRDLFTTSLTSWANFAVDPLANSWFGGITIAAILALTGVVAIRQRSRSGTPIPVTVAVVLATLVGLNAANLVAKFSVVAFRTVSSHTILLGIALIVLVDSFRSKRIKVVTLVITVAGCAIAAFGTAEHFTSYYAKGWHNLTAITAAKHGCVVDPFGRSLQPEPALSLFFQPQQSAAALHDFAYEVFLPWTLSGRCKLNSRD